MEKPARRRKGGDVTGLPAPSESLSLHPAGFLESSRRPRGRTPSVKCPIRGNHDSSRFRVLLAAALLALGSTAQAATWVAGKHYSVLPQAQRTSVPAGKIEVMEVFSYGCPALQPVPADHQKLKAACRRMPSSSTCRPRGTRPRTGRCSSAPTSRRSRWVWRKRRMTPCTTPSGQPVNWALPTHDRAPQVHAAVDRRHGAFLPARHRRKSRGFRGRVEILWRGSQDPPGGEPDHRHAGREHADAGGEWQVPR